MVELASFPEVATMDDITVLLVDDEADYREVLTKRLTKRKFHVLSAGSGEEALDILQAKAVDLVVLDVKMPGMGGAETLRLMKARVPQVEVIMLTGHANVEVTVQGMELGAFDYMIKPVDIDDLVFRLQDAYRKKCLGAQGSARAT